MTLLTLLACGSIGGTTAEPALTLPEAAHKTTFAGVTALGSFHLQASLRKQPSVGKASLETLDIRWQDTDHWSYAAARDGNLIADVRVWDAIAWSAKNGGTLEKKGDAEPFRVQLATVWDPWTWGLEGLGEGVKPVPGPVELLDGRRAVHYSLSLADIKKGHRNWTPTAVSGELWIDEATAVRVRAQVHLEAASDKRTLVTDLLFTLGDIGADPAVARP